MWQVLTTAESIDQAYAKLMTEFDVDRGRHRRDLAELLGKLIQNGLLRLGSSIGESTPAI